ncbi:hypothetical protein [Dactylosporangium sp. NPDC051541]|uniref:hypothetical protein n=1 Tax=Dactylosporangium sp. NPDC051541 TaxID=3363977 RepID=UPI0037B3EB16
MRARRLAAVLALTVSLLAACRSQPDTAVYLGDRTVSVAEVNRIVHDVNAEADRRIADWGSKRAANPDLLPPPIVHTTGAEVVSLIVLADAGQRVIAERGLDTRNAPADTIAETFGLPPTDRYVQLWTRYLTGLQSIAAAEQARPLTDDEADRLYEAGAADADVDYDTAVHAFKINTNLAPLFAAQHRLGDAMDAADITVNPQYGPVILPVVLDGRHLAVDFPEHFEEG